VSDTPGWTPPTEPGGGAGYGAPAPGYGPPPPGYGAPAGYAPGAPYGWGAAPTAPKPGVIPLRPLGLGEILDGGFSVIREYPKVTLGLSALVVTTTHLLSFGVSATNRLNGGASSANLFGGGGFTLAALAASAIGGVGLLVLAGMLTVVMGEAVLGKPATIGSTWAKVRPRFWALLGAGLVTGVVPYLAACLLFVPGIFLWGAWALTTPALVLERLGVRAAIRRSWRLAVPDWWRVWGIRALSVVIAWTVQAVVVIPAFLVAYGSVGFAADRARLDLVPLVIITVGGILAGTITAPFTSGVLALLYIDRRMRVEGLDVTLAQAAAAGTG
jgi:hypothetical protein